MVDQLSVFLENESGRLAEVAHVLTRNAVNIRALALADMAEFGILRLIVDDTGKARRVLKEAGFTVGTTDVVAVVVPDQPGGMALILDTLQVARINVEYMYAFVRKSGEQAIILFRIDEIERGVAALERAGLSLLSPDQIHQL